MKRIIQLSRRGSPDPAETPDRRSPLRAGTTLSEVLISLLVMSVGVVSLATLFPISVLRSVQATHLTNAANLRYNVEAFLSIRPELYAIGAPWEAAKTYNVGDYVTPTELTALKSPPVVFVCTSAPATRKSGSAEPDWNFTNATSTTETTGDGLVWLAYRLQNYVIDPLGDLRVETAFRKTAANGTFFGNDGTAPRAIQLPSGAYNVRAFPGIVSTNPNQVAEIATLPDSWIFQAESSSLTGVSSNTCTLNDMQVDISNIPVDTTGNYPLSRIIFFDGTGKFSEVRPITLIGPLVGSTVAVTWQASSGPLSISAVRARVESREERYSWMLSVRRGFSGTSFMDVVVFFRRPCSAKDEQVYPATFTAAMDPGYDGQPGVAGVDDDGDGTTDNGAKELGWPGADDAPRNWVVVQYDENGDEKPFFKKGGYVTDADGLRWYRIIEVVEGDLLYGYTPDGVMRKAGLKTTTNGGTLTPEAVVSTYTTPRAVFLRIENKILQSGPPVSGTNEPTGRAMFMRGVVDVYPIRTHLTWEDK